MSKYGHSSSSSSSSGVGVTGLLLVAFVVLKLIGIIDWSWCVVLSPAWIPVALILIIVAIIYIVFWVENLFKKRRKK